MPTLIIRREQVPANDVSHAFWDVYDSPNRETFVPGTTNGDAHSTLRWESSPSPAGIYAATKKVYIRKRLRLVQGSPGRIFNFHSHPQDAPGGYDGQVLIDGATTSGVSAIALDYKAGYTETNTNGGAAGVDGIRLNLRSQARGSNAGSPYGNRESWSIFRQSECTAAQNASAWITWCMEITFGFANSTPKGAVKIWVNGETTPRVDLVGVNTIYRDQGMFTVWEGLYDNNAFSSLAIIDHVPYQCGRTPAECIADTPVLYTSWSATQTGTGGNGTGSTTGSVDSDTLFVPEEWGVTGGGGGFEDPAPPTNFLGKANSGGTAAPAGINGNRGSVFVAPTTGTISALKFRGKGNGTVGQTVKMKGHVYAVGSGEVPGALLKAGTEVTRAGDFADEWITLPLASSLAVVQGTKYALHVQTGGDATTQIFYDTGPAGAFHFGSDPYDFGTADPAVVSDTQAREMSIYSDISVVANPHSRPIQDISSGGWTPVGGGSLFSVLDEASAGDTDYITSPLSPSAPAVAEMKLGAIPTPSAKTGHIVRYRYKKSASGGDLLNLVVRLLEGSKVIATWTHVNITDTLTTVAQTLTSDQAETIRDYTNLRMRFEVTKIDTDNEINVLTQFGTTDAQVRAAIAASESQGKNLYFPAGTYNFSTTPIVNNGKRWRGDGPTTIIVAATPANSAVTLQGANPILRDMKIHCPSASTRLTNEQSAAIRVNGATGFLVQNVETGIVGSVAFFSNGASDGKILGNYFHDSLADGIHITNGSHDIEVAYNKIVNSGDDFIGVISYTSQAVRNYNINVHDNYGSTQSAPGRGIAFNGVHDCQCLRNSVLHTKAAGILCATETGTFVTPSTEHIVVSDNFIRDPDQNNIHSCNIKLSGQNPGTVVDDISGTNNNCDDSKPVFNTSGNVTNATVSGFHGN